MKEEQIKELCKQLIENNKPLSVAEKESFKTAVDSAKTRGELLSIALTYYTR